MRFKGNLLGCSSPAAGLLLLTFAATAPVVACGGGESAEQAARAAVIGLQRDLERGDPRSACARLTSAARRRMRRAGGHPGADCAAGLAAFAEAAARARVDGPLEIEAVELDGGRGAVTTARRDGAPARIPVVATGGRWAVDALLDDRRAVLPLPAGRPVRAADALLDGRAPCSYINPDDEPPTLNDCFFGALAPSVAISAPTLLGEVEVRDCGLVHTYLIGGVGRTYATDFLAGCKSLSACGTARRGFAPWRGRIRIGPGGRLRNRFGLCLDTALGRVTGKVDLELSHDRPKWRLIADRAPVGGTAFELDGVWTLNFSEELAIERRGG